MYSGGTKFISCFASSRLRRYVWVCGECNSMLQLEYILWKFIDVYRLPVCAKYRGFIASTSRVHTVNSHWMACSLPLACELHECITRSFAFQIVDIYDISNIVAGETNSYTYILVREWSSNPTRTHTQRNVPTKSISFNCPGL